MWGDLPCGLHKRRSKGGSGVCMRVCITRSVRPVRVACSISKQCMRLFEEGLNILLSGSAELGQGLHCVQARSRPQSSLPGYGLYRVGI